MKNQASRKFLAIFLCFCMVLSVGFTGSVYAENSAGSNPFLVNPDFEMSSPDGSIPGWTQIIGVGNNGSVSLDTAITYSGSKSLKIYDNDAVNFAVESNKMEINPNATYTVSAAVYLASGSVQLQIRFYDSAGKLLSGGIVVNDPNFTSSPLGQWQRISVKARPINGTQYASVVLVSPKTAKGTSYWDDILVAEDLDPDLGTYGSLQNPNFELPLQDGKIPQWKQTAGKQGFVLDQQIKYEGNNSLKMAVASNDAMGIISNYVTVTPGHTYTVTSKVYGSGTGNAEIHLLFFDQNNQEIQNGYGVLNQPQPNWSQIEVSQTAPANAVKAAVLLYSGSQGTYYFDKVEWKEQLPPPAPKRFLTNAGFEAPVTETGIPGWKVNAGNASVSQAQVFRGTNSLYVENQQTTGKGINLESDLIDVQEGATYLLSANVFLESGAMQGLYVYVYDDAGKLVKSADGKDFHAYLDATSPAGEWVYKDMAFTVQPGGKKLKVSLISGNKKSYKFYLDDISILKSVTNGDFEQNVVNGGIPGWKKFNEATDGSKFGVTGDRYSSGSKSLYLESEAGKYLNVISDLIEVEPGETYTAIAKNYIEYGSADMYVRFFDRSGKYIGKQAWSIKSEPTGSWFTNYVKAEVPAEASYAAVMFAGSANKTFKYYADEVKFLKGDHEIKADPVPENSIVNVGQDLGVQIRKATLMRGDYGKDGDGRDVLYTVAAGAPSVFNIIDIETEKVIKSMPLDNTSGAWSVKVSEDGSVYLGAYNLGLLYRYIPQTGELKNLGHPLPSKDSVLYPMASGKNGKMYGGTYPTGSLYEYDPVTNKFTDYGTMAYTSSGERWTRVVVYDSENNKIYAGVGNQPRLVEYDLATGAKRDLLPPQYNNIISVYDLNLEGGKLFARKEANHSNEMFVLNAKTGELVQMTNGDTGEKVYDFPNYSRGVSPKSPIENKVYFAGEKGMLYSYDLDTDTVKSLGVSVDGAIIGYGFVQLKEEGFPGYSLVGLTGNNGKMFKYNLQTGKVKLTDVNVPAEPVNIHDIEKGPDGKIYTSGYLQGNLGVYTPSTGQSFYLNGISQIEGMTTIGNKMYFGTYPDAKIYEYDLSKPWNRDNADKLNPALLFSLKENPDIPGYTLQDRPFGMAGSEEMNKLFVGTVPKNSLLGGVLAVYDLNTRGNPQVYWNLVPGQSILSLVYKDGKLYGGTSIYGGQGGTPTANEAVLFVWDVAKGEKVFETVPVPGKKSITALHVGPDGNIWGLANGALFIFDPVQQKVIYSKDEFPDAAGRWIDGSMETGTDGNVYATVGGRFFKVDAATKAVTVLATQARKLAQDDFGNFYLYTDPESPNLYKYTDPQLIVKLTGAELTVAKTSLTVGDQIPLSIKGILEKGRTTSDLAGAAITYTVSQPDAVKIDNGIIEAKRAGSVRISATVTMGQVSVQSNVIELEISPATTVDKSALQAKIAEAEAIKPDGYTKESYAVLTEKLDAAKTVMANADATEEEVSAALNALDEAVRGLQLVHDVPGSSPDGDIPYRGTENPLQNSVKDGRIVVDKGNVTVKDGIASVNVMRNSFDEAVNQAVKANQKVVTIQAPETKDIGQVTIQLPAAAQELAKDKGIEKIRVATSIGEIAITLEAFKNQAAKDKIEISIARVDNNDLEPELARMIGNQQVYDFNLYADGQKVTNFTAQKAIEITLSYNLKPGEDPYKVVVYYINDSGKLEVMKNSRYDEKSKTVTFTTNHLSKFMAKEAFVAFKDVEDTSWSKSYIDALAARGIISGKTDSQFAPRDNITRAEFLKLLMEAFDLIDDQAEAGFSDVEKGAWYYKAVASAEKLGIVSGVGDNKFGTHDLITRQDMAVMMHRAAKAARIELKKVKDQVSFNDTAAIGAYSLESVMALQAAGILDGMDGNRFEPQATTTREQSAKVTYLLFELNIE